MRPALPLAVALALLSAPAGGLAWDPPNVAYRPNRLFVLASATTRLRAARLFEALARTVSKYGRPLRR